jgi:hypothetical protein
VEELKAECSEGVDESAVSGQRTAVKIYPNPSSNSITIELPSTSIQQNNFLTIYNINGQQIIKGQITTPQNAVDISGLVPGVYFVKVVSDEGVMVGKFVKQ